MAERPERAYRKKLLCAATAAAAATTATTAAATTTATTPGSATLANGMRLFTVCSPRFFSLSLCHQSFGDEGVPDVYATQAYVVDTD